MTIFLFLAVLFVLILVHEWGHFIVAKKTGMQVDEFGIGFPPKLFGKKWRGTEYTLNLLPIGGFVKIKGENAEDIAKGGDADPDSFVAKSKWAQAAVLVAGVSMNILFAWLLFVTVFIIGVPTVVDSVEATDSAKLTVTQVLEGGPAAEAGIPVGAQIVSVSAGTAQLQTNTPEEFSEFIAAQDAPLQITYTLGNETQTRMVLSEENIIADDPQRRAIGVALALTQIEKMPVYTAAYEATMFTGNALKGITLGLFTLIAQSIQGDADFSQVAGPVGIAGLVGDAAAVGITSLLMFTAVISLNLAVINMLPFPALDGGRLLFVGIEALLRRPINPQWVARLNFTGFALLMLLMVAVTWNDITRLL